MVGFEPTGTLRELAWSAEEKQATDWDHTAEILANQTNLAARKHVVEASKLNQYRNAIKRRDQLPPTLADMTDFLLD